MSLLSVRDLSVTFAVHQGKRFPWSPPKTLHAVNGVSFEVERGKTLGIVGESGCGKSTLIRAIAGLNPPSDGEVVFDGKRVDYQSRSMMNKLRRDIQMIFQDPIASLNPRMPIRDIVSEPLKLLRRDLDSKQQALLVRDMLDRVGIAERNFNRYPHEFSGGQCQRIGIARALVASPKVLLCDEPVSALDVSIQAQVVNLLKELQAEMDLTLLFVAHDLSVVRHISDDILVMYMGGVMEAAKASTLAKSPQHPYTQALLSAVPIPDPKAKIKPQILDGDLPSPINLPPGCLFETRCPCRSARCQTARPEPRAIEDGVVSCLLVEG